MGQAEEKQLFSPGLEFNPPAHGVWNIVHVGMTVPEAHQIYVCAINCMRGVILTAAEMNASDRFSFVILEEADLLAGTVEDATIDGTIQVLKKLPVLPKAVLLFTVCMHRFLGCDLDRIYGALEKAFPETTFIRCTMEPIAQKGGRSADQRLRRHIFDPIQPLPPREKTAVILGGDFPIDAGSELKLLLSENGVGCREHVGCKTYEEFLGLGDASLYISVFPRAEYGVSALASRLGRETVYLPASFDYTEIMEELSRLSALLGIPENDWTDRIEACESRLSALKNSLGDTKVSIDFTAHPRPLGLALLLLEHGIQVDTVFLDSVSGEERPAFFRLREKYPHLTLTATNQPECRVMERRGQEKRLAVGQIAAWAWDTPWFVNIVEGAGLWGFDGILQMADMMEEAFLQEKDTEDLVPRKGLGCESCV